MKTSFRQAIQSGTAVAVAPAKETSENALPVAKQESRVLAPVTTTPPIKGLTGEWGTGDIQIPRLSLVQKSGTLADEFPKGAFVFNKELVIGDGNQPFDITVLSARKYYQEDLPFGESDELPRVFERLEDARAAGFTTDWDSNLPRVKEAADLVVLIPVPLEYATVRFNDRGYTRALWTLVSSAYNSAAKPIVTAAVCGHLREGIHRGGWDVTSALRTNQRNSWYVPVVRARGLHQSTFLNFVEESVL